MTAPAQPVRHDAPTRIFCFIEDLFFLAKIQETSRKLGVKVEFVKGDKEAQLTLMLNGKNVMPSWKGLSDIELAAAATFTRNSWSNKTGEVIQPSDVKAARK